MAKGLQGLMRKKIRRNPKASSLNAASVSKRPKLEVSGPKPHTLLPSSTFQILTTSLNLEDLNPSQLQVLRSISPKPESRKP